MTTSYAVVKRYESYSFVDSMHGSLKGAEWESSNLAGEMQRAGFRVSKEGDTYTCTKTYGKIPNSFFPMNPKLDRPNLYKVVIAIEKRTSR